MSDFIKNPFREYRLTVTKVVFELRYFKHWLNSTRRLTVTKVVFEYIGIIQV